MLEREESKMYRRLVLATILTLGVGVLFYHFFEGFSWVDAFYFSVITLTTVGYGDLTPQTPLGKLFTTFYILIGVGIIATFVRYTVSRRNKLPLLHKHTDETVPEKQQPLDL